MDQQRLPALSVWTSAPAAPFPLDSVTLAETTVDPNAEILNLGIIIRPDQRDGVKRALREKLAGTVEIVSSDFDNLDLVRPDCSKASALGILAERIGVPLREVIVIGDSENDVGMFDVVDTSYCMAQAEPEVRQKARWVVTSVAEALARERPRVGIYLSCLKPLSRL